MPRHLLKALAVSASLSLLFSPTSAIAHCGSCDLGAAQLLETTAKKRNAEIVSESLWGNLILSMAYQRDPELQKLTKRQGVANLVTLGSVGAISGLSLAQNVLFLSPGGAHGAHQAVTAEGEEHAEGAHAEGGHSETKVPGILGLVASGGTMFALASQVYINHRYRNKIKKRQATILKRVEEVLQHLEADAQCLDCQKELAGIIGERAAREFLQIWKSSHAVASAGSSG